MFWTMFIPGSSHDFKNSCIKHEFKIHSSARKGPMPGSHLPHLAMQSRPAMSQDLSMTNAPGLITAICPISIDTTTLEPMSAESQAHHRWNLSPSVESQVPNAAIGDWLGNADLPDRLERIGRTFDRHPRRI